MSDNWNDLEKLWQSLPPKAAPAVEELRRQHRWRWASYALIAGDAGMTLIGLAAGVWLTTRHNTFTVLLGGATIVFALAAAALAWWARAIKKVRLDDPIKQAAASAVRRARIGVRMALGVQWAVCFGIMFTALIAIGKSFSAATMDANAVQISFTALAIAQAWLAVCLGASIVYGHRRRADLARLEAVALSLED